MIMQQDISIRKLFSSPPSSTPSGMEGPSLTYTLLRPVCSANGFTGNFQRTHSGWLATLRSHLALCSVIAVYSSNDCVGSRMYCCVPVRTTTFRDSSWYASIMLPRYVSITKKKKKMQTVMQVCLRGASSKKVVQIIAECVYFVQTDNHKPRKF